MPYRGAIVPSPTSYKEVKVRRTRFLFIFFFSLIVFIIIIVIIGFAFASDPGEEGWRPSFPAPRGAGPRPEALPSAKAREKRQQAKRVGGSQFVGPASPSLDVASQSPLPTPSNLAPPPTPPALPSAASFAGWPLGGGPSIAVPRRGCR